MGLIDKQPPSAEELARRGIGVEKPVKAEPAPKPAAKAAKAKAKAKAPVKGKANGKL